MINVLIADDHHVVRRGLLFFLKTQKDIEVVGEACNGKEAVELTKELHPDIVLMDLVMPEMDGIQATKRIKAKYPEIQILMLTSFSDRDHVVPAIEAGAAGYQLKDIEPDELVLAIRRIMAGENIMHPQATTQLIRNREIMEDLPHVKHPLRNGKPFRSRCKFQCFFVVRYVFCLYMYCTAAALCHFKAVSQECKACNIGAAVDRVFNHYIPCCFVEGCHLQIYFFHQCFICQISFGSSCNNADTQRFCQHKYIPRLCTAVGKHFARTYKACDRKTVNRFGTFDGVTACDNCTCIIGSIITAAQNLPHG